MPAKYNIKLLKRNENSEVSENQKVLTGYPGGVGKVKDHSFSLSSHTLTLGKTSE